MGGSGYYYYAEATGGNLNDLSTLAYDGSACADLGLAVTSVSFHYHMYGGKMGKLRLVDAAGQEAWSMSGNQGTAWKEASVPNVFSPSFAFEYTRGDGFEGDAAVGQVRRRPCVACDAVNSIEPCGPACIRSTDLLLCACFCAGGGDLWGSAAVAAAATRVAAVRAAVAAAA